MAVQPGNSGYIQSQGGGMKYRSIAVAILAVLGVLPGLAQSSQSDSQTLMAILTEIRTIREELKVTETTQILLTELQIQQSVVARATQRVDDLQSHLASIQAGEKYAADELARAEDQVNQTTDPAKEQALSEKINQLKSDAAGVKLSEQNHSDGLQKAQEILREAQDDLDSIQIELNSIVKRLKTTSN